MGKLDKPGYPLPAGDTYTEELACTFLWYPNKPEYRQALRASLHYLGSWLAWERDGTTRARDAAQAWKNANDLTEECIEMNLCETMLDLLTEIERNTRTCCGQSTYVTYQSNTIITTTIVPGSGPDPTVYGETAVADWNEWLEYVCYQANAYVDDLIETANTLDTAVSAGGYVLDFIAHLFSLVQWRMVEDIIPVNFSVIQAIFNALGQGLIQNEFGSLAADFETYRNDIVCAIIQGTSLELAIQDIVGTGLLWTVYYSWFDYDTTQAIIYEGGVDGVGYLTPIKSQACDCDFEPANPTGYTWVHPPAGSYFWTTNIGSHSESYDPATGLLTITVTSGGGDQLEYGHAFGDVGSPLDDPFEYAYCFDLVSSSVPSVIDILYNLDLRIAPAQANDGLVFGGYNTTWNSGAEWDNMVAAFDVVTNYTATHQDRIRMVEDPNKTAIPSSQYTFTVRVWALAKN